MRVELEAVQPLRFDDGTPVRAASAVVAFGGGWLVAQDDATAAAWLRPGSITPLRLLPAVDGHDRFDEASGTKHLKPDLEAAAALDPGAVVFLGSGSGVRRTRAVVVRHGVHGPRATAVELAPLHDAVGAVLGRGPSERNLEGLCPVGDRLRWFDRGVPLAGALPASVDLDRRHLVEALAGGRGPGDVALTGPRHHDLGRVDGIGLAITDAVTLPDGRVLVSAAAEDTLDPTLDGPVVASVLAILGDDGRAVTAATTPDPGGGPHKVEGLALAGATSDGVRLLAVVDADDPDRPSLALHLRLRLA